jgi:hypothetical protein
MIMAKEWQTFCRRYEDLKIGNTQLFIKDLTPGPNKYNTFHVIAEIAKSKEDLPGADILWLRSESGLCAKEPLYLKIIEELPPYVAGRPYENVFAALERAQKERSSNG